jgi:acyl-CoA synthetase (AMP-forming)/AMP-acid ligase II
MPTATNLSELVARVVDEHGDVEAYVEGDRRTTYAEWLRRSDAVAAMWREIGVTNGDVVAIALPSSTDFAVSYLAAVRLGAVVTGLNTRLGPRELHGVLERCAPVVVVCEESSALPEVGVRFSPADLDGAAESGLTLPRPHRTAPTDPLCIVWTSGSTGDPKGAWFDHRANQQLAGMSGVLSRPMDRRLMPFPFAHAGYMTRVWDQVEHVITSVLPVGPWSAVGMLQTLANERISVGQGVPTQWAKLVELPALEGVDLSTLRVCATGAAPVPPDLVRAMLDRLGCPVVVRYACTEAPILTGTSPGDAPEVLLHTVGQPADGVEIELVTAAGEPVDAGSVGMIRVRSAGAMRGYWEGGPTPADEALDWIELGDLGRFESDGNLVLCGRTTDMYIRGGYNVYPLEVQRVIEEHPLVAAAAVIGVDADVIGQIGVAFVVVRDEDPGIDADDVRAWVRDRLADYKVPDQVRFVAELPVNSMMKIDTRRLRELTSIEAQETST